MTRYANAWQLEAVTPFWMQTFFLYVGGNEPNGALDAEYNRQVAAAIANNKRTHTFWEFKEIIKNW